MNTPAGNPHVIADLYQGVVDALAGKTNISADQSARAVKKTLLNLTESYPFEELKTLGPMVTIGPGLGVAGSNFQYYISSFLNSGDDYTLTFDPVIFLNPTQAAQVGLVNAGTSSAGAVVGFGMQAMTMKAIQPLLFIPGGIPFKYCRFGQFFLFGSQPGQPYQVYLPYQKRHPFSDSSLPQSPLYIPTSWEDVVEYAAALRLAQTNNWPDMVRQLRVVLYGDPKSPGEPGLLKAMVSQISRDQMNSTRQIEPQVARY